MYLPVYVKWYKVNNYQATMWFNILGKSNIEDKYTDKVERLYIETMVINTYDCHAVNARTATVKYNDLKRVYNFLKRWIKYETTLEDSVSIKLYDTIDLIFESGIYYNMITYTISYHEMKSESSPYFISSYLVKEAANYDLNQYEAIQLTDMLKEVLDDLNYLDEGE